MKTAALLLLLLAFVGAGPTAPPPGWNGMRSRMQTFQRPPSWKPVFGYKGDAGNYPPPGSGAFAYTGFVPVGSYLDPVFNETVRRLTSDHAHDDIYARN